ncbi:MAG: hypothetical protein ACXWP1_09390 [Bdellovibrionota bacterium]
MNRHPITALGLILALLAPAAPLRAEGPDNIDCQECGLRKPGSRPRELAILASADKIAEFARRPGAPPSDLDFSAAARLPEHTRPTALEADSFSALNPLVRAMNTDPILFKRMRYLLPPKFRIADGTKFQPMIDDAIINLAGTDAGRKAVCPFAANSEKDVQSYFQVSANAAHVIRAGCAGYSVPPALVHRLRMMSEVMPPFQPEPQVPPKKFIFLFSDSGPTEIEGYTAKNNTTYLVLSQENMNRDSLQRMISHEIAMSYDQLSRLGYLLNPQSIEDMGVNFAFGKEIADPHVFVDPPMKQVEQMKCAFRDPALMYAAAAQRAFLFEDSVASETTQSPAVATAGSCGQVLAKNSVLLQGMARSVSWYTGYFTGQCGIATDPAARLQQILGRIRTIEASVLTCRNPKDCGGKPTMSLCDLLLHPRIGPNSEDLDSGGPRPRMGGGWDSAAVEREDLIDRASKGQALTSAEIKAVGESLAFPDIDQLEREEDAIPRPGSKKLTELSP